MLILLLEHLSHYTGLGENKVAATYEPIATTTLGSAASSITFSSIASTWTDLRLVLVGTNVSSGYMWILRLNSDSSSNYSNTRLYGTGASAGSGRSTSVTSAWIGDSNLNNSTTIPNLSTIDIFSYAGSTYKTLLSTSSTDLNGSGNVIGFVNLWRSTSAITTITLLNDGASNFAAGTTATLYGLKSA